ncbi:mediator of RNA polymerase II transcription subunit 15a isoform X2 [Silene latifolia]|uniref:mediator of RNA polymerase II transcription subunit 15a isoform X2 n=1 Tax=Silene latifolia TaxID=37657 RepID=UPI003D77A9A0
MDSNNWRPPQSDAQPPPVDAVDWRSQLQPDSRQRIVNKIMETLKRHLPFSGQDGLQELKQIAIRFEEKIYSAATSQSDYLRKISLKMLTMESKSQSSLPNAMPSNSAGVSSNPQDPVASQNGQAQVHKQNQSASLQMVPNQSQPHQQLSTQNTQNNVTSTTASLPNTLATNGLAQNTTPNVGQNSNLQNISGISQSSMGNTMNQGTASNVFSNGQRQLQGRQQQVVSQQHPQQTHNSQQYMYQQQFQQQMLKQKLQQQSIQQQSAQQQMMQTSSVMQSSMISGLQPNQQQSSIQQVQQPTQSMLQQHQQSVIKQQQQHQQQQQVLGPQPNAGHMQQSQLISQQPNSGNMMQSQLIGQQLNSGNMQQMQLIGQQPNSGNLQQSQLIGQQSNISDIQQQQQQQRLLGQQNNVSNLSPQQPANQQNMPQQQHLMGQQRNLQNMHQQQLGHQSHVGGQQLIGTQSGNASMQTNQHSMHMMQQSKVPVQQQNHNTASILPGGGQQQQQSQSQQQLMSQLQSQSTPLQQQLAMQQQQPNSIQHNMQQRIQNMNPVLQQQNLIDPLKMFQSQRATPEGPSTSLDSTAQTSSANTGDWQEEVYQKIKSMKDLYYADLNEMYQKISIKLQQHDALPQQPKIDQIEKLRVFKHMLERLMQVLQITKSNILLSHREKLPSFEKQIVTLLNSNRPRKLVPSNMPPQLPSMQQSHSLVPQAQSHDVVNPPLQSMNFPGSISTIQQSSMPSLQQGSIPSLSGITSSQPPSSNLDSGKANTPSSMQQAAISSMQQNITSLQPNSGVGLPQPNVNNLQSNSNMLQNQHLKQQHEQQTIQAQQLKNIQNKQMQQHFQKQQLLQQQQQQLHQQAKQQQASQMQAHQMPQLLRSGGFQQHISSTQRFLNQQLKPGASFQVSSPQLLNAVSPQINQHSSPQIDQQNLPPVFPKGGTPLHSASSPYVPSPSTPLAPSPMPGDIEKPAVSSLSNVGHQQTSGGAIAAPQSLSIGTPGISPSPLFECAGQDGTHCNASTVSGKSSVTEQPIERLLRAVKSLSPKALSAAVSDMSSVVSMVDRIAGSAPGNGSRATVGEDLVAMTKCRLQARNFLAQDGGSGTKRMRRYTSAMPLNFGPSVGSVNDSLKQLNGPPGTPELESTATSAIKKARIEVNHALLEEIREINERLIDTVVDISDESMDPSLVALAAEGSEGTIVKFSYNAITISPSLRSQYMSGQMSPIQPLKLLIPASYPNCSPILLDKLSIGDSNELGDLSAKAKSRFSISLRCLSQPMSLKDIARTWDACARAVICEYAQQKGGGSFSSKYGTWENCLGTA